MNDIREGYGDNPQQVTNNSSSYVCMHLPTPVVERSNYVMHASSLSYPSSSPTLHADSKTFEALNLGPEHVCGMRTYDPMTDMLARECDRPARWFRVCGRCGVDGFACNPCRQWAIVSGSCRGCKPGHAWVAEAWHWRPL